MINEIKKGLEKEAVETLTTINVMQRANLASSEIRSTKNSLIGSCTLFARAAIEAGIDPEDSFSLSDVLILKLESINNIKELIEFEYYMVDEYIKLILKIRIHNYSLPVSKIISYIHTNITEKITLEDLSNLTSTTREYTSTVFKQEVGINIVDFIHQEKINESLTFLELTDISILKISTMFSFCNSGYYSSLFKKYIGMTPTEYRKTKSTYKI
ncbi:MAG: AraC family transcriptional regulator [Bacillota bacterium]|nr:AraC family transcriptional regulator [Bacillota bacterium]